MAMSLGQAMLRPWHGPPLRWAPSDIPSWQVSVAVGSDRSQVIEAIRKLKVHEYKDEDERYRLREHIERMVRHPYIYDLVYADDAEELSAEDIYEAAMAWDSAIVPPGNGA